MGELLYSKNNFSSDFSGPFLTACCVPAPKVSNKMILISSPSDFVHLLRRFNSQILYDAQVQIN